MAYCLSGVVRSVARYILPQLSQSLGAMRDLSSVSTKGLPPTLLSSSHQQQQATHQPRSSDPNLHMGGAGGAMSAAALAAEQRQLSATPLRKLLYESFSSWTEEGFPSGGLSFFGYRG